MAMSRGKRRRLARKAVRRRKRIAWIKAAQGYTVPAPERIADGYFRKGGFLCHRYGSVREKRKFRQQANGRYWKHRPHMTPKYLNCGRNELRQMDSMDDKEREYEKRNNGD